MPKQQFSRPWSQSTFFKAMGPKQLSQEAMGPNQLNQETMGPNQLDQEAMGRNQKAMGPRCKIQFSRATEPTTKQFQRGQGATNNFRGLSANKQFQRSLSANKHFQMTNSIPRSKLKTIELNASYIHYIYI